MGGWVQIAGPVQRLAQFKAIETTFGGQNLQQLRWPPTNTGLAGIAADFVAEHVLGDYRLCKVFRCA